MRANDAWESLLTAHAAMFRQLSGHRDIWADISTKEYDVLYTLSKCPGPASLGELNRHVLLSQPAMSRMVDRLACRALIARSTDPDDRRGVRLSLTAAGRELQRRVGRQHARDVARAMTSALTNEELRQLTAICRKLADGPQAGTRPAGSPREEGRQ